MKEYRKDALWGLSELEAVRAAQDGQFIQVREVDEWKRFIPPPPIGVGDVLSHSLSPYARTRYRTVRALLTNRDGVEFAVIEMHDTGVIYSVPLKDVQHFKREPRDACNSGPWEY